MDEYASEFIHLSKFMPYMITNEADVHIFFSRDWDFTSKVCGNLPTGDLYWGNWCNYKCRASCEQGVEGSSVYTKRTTSQVLGGTTSWNSEKCPVVTSHQKVTCRHCHRLGHIIKECWYSNQLSLACGSSEHMIRDCLQRKVTGLAPCHPYLNNSNNNRRADQQLGKATTYFV